MEDGGGDGCGFRVLSERENVDRKKWVDEIEIGRENKF